MTRLRPIFTLAAGGLAALAVSAAAPAAHASVTCTSSAGTDSVSLAPGDSATIERFGNFIHVNNQQCGDVNSVTAINVTGTSGSAAETVTINLSGGAFASSGAAEIGFSIALAGSPSTVRVVGSAGPDDIVLGSPGAGQGSINLNAGSGNSTSDVSLSGVDAVVVNPGSANDIVNGQGGSGTGNPLGLTLDISGGAGNDNLTLGDGAGSRVDPGLGDDRAVGGANDDTLVSSSGNDVIDGAGGSDTFDASAETAGIRVNLAQGTATGASAGTDTLANVENVKGTNFADSIVGDQSANQLVGALGNDAISGIAGADTVNGGGGNDLINGGPGSDILNGFGGNDRFIASDGNDAIDGGSGSETNSIDFSTQTGAVTVDLSGTGSDTKPGGSDTMLNAINNVTGSPFGDTIVGNGHANVIVAGAGDDSVSAAGGSDTVNGGPGTNSLDGGSGVGDLVYYGWATSGVHASLSTNAAGGTGFNDTLAHFENVTGSAHDDVITGDSGNNSLRGGLGHDSMNGMSGDDTIDMGVSNDGSDIARGGPGTDTALYSVRTGNLHISLDGVANDGASGERDNVHGDIENVIAGRGNDLIMGNKFDNRLNGGAGHNTLGVTNAPRGVRVNLTNHTASNWGHDVVIGFQNVVGSRFGDSITGNALNNALLGEAGNDTLSGGAGNDFLNGGPGTDHCSGGSGSNSLVSC